jgi:hypothetical protein
MENMSQFASIFSVLIVQIPLILVWLVGIIIAIARWKKHPRISLLSVIAITGLLFLSIAGNYLGMWLPVMLRANNWNISRIGVINTAVGFVRSLLSAILWGLILAAIFSKRNDKDQETKD